MEHHYPSYPSYDHYDYHQEQPVYAGDMSHSPVSYQPAPFTTSHEGKFRVQVNVKRAFSFEELQSGAYFHSLDESDLQFFRIYGQPVFIPSAEDGEGDFELHNHSDLHPTLDGTSCGVASQSAPPTDPKRLHVYKSYTLANSLGDCATQMPAQLRGRSTTLPVKASTHHNESGSNRMMSAELVYPSDYPSSTAVAVHTYPPHGHNGVPMASLASSCSPTTEYGEQKPMLPLYSEEPPMASLPPPPAVHPMPHFQPSPPPQDQVVRSDLSYSSNPTFHVGTSQDEWEEIQPPRLTVPTQSYVDEMTSPEDSTFVHSHQYSRGHSHCDSTQRQTRSPSPRSSNARMSPTPHGKRSMEKKPALACLFCRGRKIACGPPLPGSKDKTCNQCARRQLKCEYPLESRRGMRKRRSLVPRASSAAPEINPDGPKVTIKSNRKRAVEKRPR